MKEQAEKILDAVRVAEPATERIRASLFDMASRLIQQQQEVDRSIERIQEDRKRGARLTKHRFSL